MGKHKNKEDSKYGKHPQIMDCPQCKCHIVTDAVTKFTLKTHAVAAVLCIALLFWIPYLSGCFKVINHYCPVCESYLGSYPPSSN